MTSIPRIDIDPDGVIVEVVDIAGDQRDLWAWGLVIPSDGDDIAALLLTDSHEPPTADQRAALGKALFDPSGEATAMAEKISTSMADHVSALQRRLVAEAQAHAANVDRLQQALAERTAERDDARGHASRAWAQIDELNRRVVAAETSEQCTAAEARDQVRQLTEQRDEAREQNVILGRRLAGEVGEQLDVLGRRWEHEKETRSWRVPPLDHDEQQAVREALNAVGVGLTTSAGAPELLAALRALDDATAARYLQQLQQLADDGRECWERHHPHMQTRLAQQHRDLFEANQRAYAADEAVGPIRRRRDELINELARVKTENGLWAVDELKAIDEALHDRGDFPRSNVGDAVHNLRGRAEVAERALADARTQVAAARQAATLSHRIRTIAGTIRREATR